MAQGKEGGGLDPRFWSQALCPITAQAWKGMSHLQASDSLSACYSDGSPLPALLGGHRHPQCSTWLPVGASSMPVAVIPSNEGMKSLTELN